METTGNYDIILRSLLKSIFQLQLAKTPPGRSVNDLLLHTGSAVSKASASMICLEGLHRED